MVKRALLYAVVFFELSRSQQTTSGVTCLPSFEYLFNSKGQSPCLVAAYLIGACFTQDSTIGPLDPGYNYGGPSDGGITPCNCNTVTYSMVGACSACQNGTWISWTSWNQSCPYFDDYISVYPQDIPSNTSVPAWAYADVTKNNTFDLSVALSNTAPESSATNSMTHTSTSVASSTTQASITSSVNTQADTSTPSSTSSSDKKKPSNTGAIAGGAVGGIVGLVLISLLAFFLIRRNKRKNATSTVVMDANMSPLIMGKSDGSGFATTLAPSPRISPYPQEHSTQQKLYNPNDPSTFPYPPQISTEMAPTPVPQYARPTGAYAYTGVPEV